MRSSSPRGAGVTGRAPAFRLAHVAGLALALLLPAPRAGADTERVRLTIGVARSLSRFHSIEADTSGLSYVVANSPEAEIDFRVLDLPMPKGPRPALHLTAGTVRDERVVGAFRAGQPLLREPVLVMTSGVYLLVPLELVRPNTGVALRIGWAGAYTIGRTGAADFITLSKARVGFERTAGWFEGSGIDVGMGRDDTFGHDYATTRWDVHVALRGRLLPPPITTATPKGAKPAPPREETRRVAWVFVDIDVDTDGGGGPDGLLLRFGVATDVVGILQSAFGPSAH